MSEVNTRLDPTLQPMNGFKFGLSSNKIPVATFHDLIFSIKSPFEIDFVLEQGLCDAAWFNKYVDILDREEQEVDIKREFEIYFDNYSDPEGLDVELNVKGVYTINHCKITKVQFGIMPGRHIAAVKFTGKASMFNFTPS